MTVPLSDPAVTWDLDLMVTADEEEEPCSDPIFQRCTNVATHVVQQACGCSHQACLSCAEQELKDFEEMVTPTSRPVFQCFTCFERFMTITIRPKGK